MSGSHMTARERALEMLKKASPADDFVWDGITEDERPLTSEEIRDGLAEMKRRGRPFGSNKESTTIRFDADVLNAFRSRGPGWQSRMNAALREWLETHPVRG